MQLSWMVGWMHGWRHAGNPYVHSFHVTGPMHAFGGGWAPTLAANKALEACWLPMLSQAR